MILLDRADRETDLAAAAAGVADYLVRPSADTLERSLRYAIAHQRALAAGGVRGALRARAPGRQRRPVGLGRARRPAVLLPALEGDARPPGGRVGDAPGSGSAACTPTTAPRSQALEAHSPARRSTSSHEHRIQHRDGGYRWMLARGIAVRDHTGRATRVVGSQTDITDRSEAERRPRTTRCTTR